MIIGPSEIFLEHWTLRSESTSSDPQLQNKNKCIHLQPAFSVYIHESWTLGKPYGIKLRCYWERLKEQIGGTPWEHVGDTMGTRKKYKKKLPPPHPQKEKTGPRVGACWAFSLAA
jgi:hypothetical protein